jgi:hypothetical protein
MYPFADKYLHGSEQGMPVRQKEKAGKVFIRRGFCDI